MGPIEIFLLGFEDFHDTGEGWRPSPEPSVQQRVRD